MQFTLRTLLVVFIFVASALGLGGVWGLAAMVGLVFLVVSRRLASAYGCLAAVVFAAVSLSLLLPAFFVWCVRTRCTLRMCAQQAMCTHQLKEIALGLRSYHDKYGVFPPPYVADAQGKPMHSWRVLILPFVGMDSVYNVYRFDEPWDSKNNKKLADMMSLYYACPGKYDDTPPWTDYVALIGPGTMWEEGRACKLEDITDGPKRTLMIVEMADSGIPWNAPFDVPLKEVLAIDPELAKTIRSYHLSKYADEPQPMGNVAFADGHVDCVPGPLTPENFKALVTIAGGENVDTRNLEALTVPRLKPFMSLFWTRLIGWAILLVSFVYLVSRPLPERWIRPRGQAEAAEVSNTASDNKAM